jgi:desulfoferrodoxin (superoxide reductase-like protein)
MKLWKIKLLLPVLILATQLLCGAAYANKSSVTIQAPSEAVKGSELVITVTAKHNANNFMHHTEWLYVMVNDQEVGRWNFSAFNRPPGEVFSKEIKVTATGDLNIKAEASCNLHGSSGPATAGVAVK